MVHKGVQHTQRAQQFVMVTFGVHIREQGHTTKVGIFAQQREEDRLYDFEKNLDEERQAPSGSQVAPHGKTCASLR